MFIDFFEIAFIVIPILAPVADKILPELLPPGTPASLVLIWFGVIIAMNLQTSFLTPPFGFALFYLRSVAARSDYKDRVTGVTIPAVTTAQIYKGAIAFIIIQLVMVVMVVAFPRLSVDTQTKGSGVDLKKIQIDIPASQSAPDANAEENKDGEEKKDESAGEDPNAAFLRALQKEQKK
jgi:hypothetical protein